jgi:hypothetical protein
MTEPRPSLDERLRARQPELRIALGLTFLAAIGAWLAGWEAVSVVLSIPGAVLLYVVATYLPRNRY